MNPALPRSNHPAEAVVLPRPAVAARFQPAGVARRFVARLATVLLALAGASASAAPTDVTAIYAATGNGYQRQRGADGKFLPETYSFGEGGRMDGTYLDNSLTPLTFLRVAQTVAGPLREQNYLPARRADETQLLILVFWGLTVGADGNQYGYGTSGVSGSIAALRARGFFDGPRLSGGLPAGMPSSVMDADALSNLESAIITNEMFNQMRDQNNRRNAAITGYYEEYLKAIDLPLMVGLAHSIVEEVEADRYFVVLKAYDFQQLRKNKTKKLLWETRFSVRQRNNRFDHMLPIMANAAGKYFGQQSGRLLRQVVPVGRVEVGTPTVVETSAK